MGVEKDNGLSVEEASDERRDAGQVSGRKRKGSFAFVSFSLNANEFMGSEVSRSNSFCFVELIKADSALMPEEDADMQR